MDRELSDDALFGGRIRLWQPRKGYRFSVDAPLLVWFAARFGDARLAADLGAGCGVVGLGLLAAGAAERLVGVEIQPDLAELAANNAARNGLADRYRVLVGDMAAAQEDRGLRRSCELVAVNPPFWPADQGRLPADEQRRVACHEVAIDLAGWIHAAGLLLRPRVGRLCAVFPARRLGSLLSRLHAEGLAADILLPVLPREGVPAELVLVSARSGTRDHLVMEPPLVLGDETGADTPTLARILDGSFSAALAARPDTRVS